MPGRTSTDELRRSPRVRVCCRVEVRQLHGVWSALTEDLSARGCRIMSRQLPRPGSRIALRISSDLFAEVLDTMGEVIWVTPERLGVVFVDRRRRSGTLSPQAWLSRVLEHHSAPDTEADADPDAPRLVVPVIGGPYREAAIYLHSRRRRQIS